MRDIKYDREYLERAIAASEAELGEELRTGNEYGVAVAEAAHGTLMWLVENYIDPMEAEIGALRATIKAYENDF